MTAVTQGKVCAARVSAPYDGAMTPLHLTGRCLVPGRAAGPALHTDVPLSFWMGIDPQTGIVIDRHHPLRGESVAGRVLVMPGGRGSCSASAGMLEMIVSGHAPAAIVFAHEESIVTLGAIVAEEMFGRTVPIVALDEAGFARLRGAPHLAVADGTVSTDPDALPDRAAPSHENHGGITLTDEDRAMLAGERGAVARLAMTIVLRMARVMGADALVDVAQAHIDGCFHTGPAGLAFAETLAAQGGRVKVPATMNALSADRRRWRAQGVEAAVGEASERVAEAYLAMGVAPSYTCAPYLLDGAPRRGQQLAWSESNAVAYANSVLGARTMKYPDFLDICVALTGRAPLADCHVEAHRHATLRIDVPALARLDDAFYPLLGYQAGLIAAHAIPVIAGLEAAAPTPDDLKAFSAAFATTASAPMFHMLGVTPEAGTLEEATGGTAPLRTVTLTLADLARGWEELNSATDGRVDLVALGNPHFSFTECARLAGLCRGRTKHPDVAVVVTCGRAIFERARAAGLAAELEHFGVQFVNDTCWCMFAEPIIPPAARALMTNSAKYAHYGPGMVKRGIHFGSLADCVHAACTGRARTGLPDWLKS